MFRYIHYELQTCVLYKMLLQKASIDRLLYLGNSASVDCISYICNMHSKTNTPAIVLKKFNINIFVFLSRCFLYKRYSCNAVSLLNVLN